MIRLEERYRSLLRLLPAAYRARWEDDMVATFLDSVASDDPEQAEWRADFSRPGRAEVASIARLAVRLRLGGPGAPPRSRLWGEAVRRFALSGLLAGALGGVMGLVQQLWVTGRLGWPPLPVWLAELALPWNRVAVVTALLPIAAFLAVSTNRWRGGRILAVVALLPALVAAASQVSAWLTGGGPLPLTPLAVAGAGVLVVAALAAFHRDAPPVAAGRWVAALAGGAGLAAIAAVLLALQARSPVLDWPGWWCVAFVVAAGRHLTIGRDRDPAWTVAFVLLGATLLTVRALTLVDLAAGANVPAALWAGAVETVAVAAVLAGLWGPTRQALRATPADAPMESRTA